MARLSAEVESSFVVRLYRGVLKPSVRHRIARRVPLALRASVKQTMGGTFGISRRLRVAAFALTTLPSRSFYRGAGRGTVLAGKRSVVAWLGTAQTPLEARRRNLDVVSEALERDGIEYFCVRGTSDTMTTVAVRSKDWEGVCVLLARLAADTSGYVTIIHGDLTTVMGARPVGRSLVRRSRSATALRLTWFRTDTTERVVFGERYGCEVERWDETPEGRLVATRRNRMTPRVPVEGAAVTASDSLFTRLAPAERDPLPGVRTRVEFIDRRSDDVLFPIDVVFTWVDGADPAWQRRRAGLPGVPYHAEAANEARYRSRDELKYALRSLQMYAPWIRDIYIVTDDQCPSWLDTDLPGVKVVDHREIFADTTVLPTFNSHAIETQLHHIEGLSEHFLYFNDDMMLGSEVIPQTFFHANGLTNYFASLVNEPQGEPVPDDVPVTIAAKNNRRILQERFGTTLTHKMKHVPYAMRRSVLEDIEKEFPDAIRTTMQSKTRGQYDISLPSSFYHYYAFATGHAVPAPIKYTYVDLSKPTARRSMGLLLARRDQEVFCLNSTRPDLNEISETELHDFLETYFPTRSRFEKE